MDRNPLVRTQFQMAFYNLDVHPVSQAFSVMLPARPLDYVETQSAM